MPAGAYIATPATNLENATYLTNGLDRLNNISPEKSYIPQSGRRDLIGDIQRARRGHGVNIKTPRASARDPLSLLPNGAPNAKSEFTPLMKSVTKNNLRRSSSGVKRMGVPDTPAALRDSMYGATPGLPRLSENSQIYVEHTSSSTGSHAVNYTPQVLQNVSSSAQSTPLAQLPGRDGAGNLAGGDGNMMTLREQENIIDKIEKENFGLKMKIHFLEEALGKRGGEFNQAALKENTDLKVTRITMQKELHKFKKNIAQAEKDAEVYRLRLEEYRQRMLRKQEDESVRIEVDRMQTVIQTKETEIERLKSKLESSGEEERMEIRKLRDDVGDLEADLRERERVIEDKEEEIDSLKSRAGKENSAAEELEEELGDARRQIEQLQEDLGRAASEAQEAKEEQQEAMQEKQQAEDNLDELRSEMVDKSFTTKGLSRQLEEKTNKLEDDLQDMKEQYQQLQQDFDAKEQAEKQLQERLRTLEREGASDNKQTLRELESAHQQLETTNRKVSNVTKDLRAVEHDLRIKSDEKDLLQTRHDALTTESAQLQQDLAKAHRAMQELDDALDTERQRSAQNDITLRSQHKIEVDHLTEQIDSLHRELNAKGNQHASEQEDWQSERRTLENASQKAEEKARGLQRTVDRLQEAEGTLSSREMKLQQALESEKQRHQEEEKVLTRQIAELNNDISDKRDASDLGRSELNNAKEELRISIREQATLKEKVGELEEEIEVLQANLEEEAEFAEQQRNKSLEGVDVQLQKVRQEKQGLQDQLANVNIDLHKARKAAREAETERDELEAKVRKADRSSDDSSNLDCEKRELRRSKLKLEKDLEKVKADRDNLNKVNADLELEINAEIERANAEEHHLQVEIDLLKNQKVSNSESRDRELKSSKSKIDRLETRLRELEDVLENQPSIASPATDVSGLRHDLVEARKNETDSKKRETDLKSKTRDLQAQIVTLERDLHEAQLATFKSSRSPSHSPPVANSKEVAQLRKDLLDSRSELKEGRAKIHGLERASRKVSVDETERADLHALLKSSTVEAEALALKVSDRDAQLSTLNTELKRLRQEQRYASRQADETTRQTDTQLVELKSQLRQLREEKTLATKRADAAARELDNLQTRYESALGRFHSSKGQHGVNDKVGSAEMRGLMKEIVWLKARWHREVEFRKALAWGKKNPQPVEADNGTWNGVNVRLLRDLGVKVSNKGRTASSLQPRHRLRAGVFAVIAGIRIRNLEQKWRGVKDLGDELRKQKNKESGARLGRWVNAALVN